MHTNFVTRLMEEFFGQGDLLEKEGRPVMPMFRRTDDPFTLAQSQCSFFEFVALPFFGAFAKVRAQYVQRVSGIFRDTSGFPGLSGLCVGACVACLRRCSRRSGWSAPRSIISTGARSWIASRWGGPRRAQEQTLLLVQPNPYRERIRSLSPAKLTSQAPSSGKQIESGADRVVHF